MKLRLRIASFVSWHRRWIAAICAALCVVGIVAATSPAEPPGTTVVVAARSLPAGHVLAATDLTTATLPPAAVTASVLRSPEAAVGATTAIALDERQPLTRAAVITGGPSAEGRSLVPIAVPDDSLRAMLRPGTTVSLILALGDAPEVIAQARIATLPPQADGTLGAAQGSRGMVVVEVASEAAALVAALGQAGQLSVVLGSL